MSASAFALSCLGVQAKQGELAGPCAVCGLETAVGRARSELSDAFAEPDQYRVPDSRVVCPACMYFAVGSTWQRHARTHPDLGIKLWAQASWRSYSHLFSRAGVLHLGPGAWRAILDAPPAPPFLVIISETARKNLISFGQVATDAMLFPVLFETTVVWIPRARWHACVDAFEALRAMGFGRDQVLSGKLHGPLVLRLGIDLVRRADAAVAPWRRDEPTLMRLVHYTSVNPKESHLRC